MKHELKKPPIPPIFVIVFGILAVSTSSILIRYAQAEVSSIVIAAYRLAIASLILGPIVAVRKRTELRDIGKKGLLLGLLSGLFLAIHFGTWISSLEFTSVSSSVMLVSTAPLWVALFSPITIKESISRATVIGMSIALIGSIVIGMSDVCRFEQGLICPPASEFFTGEAFFGDFLALIGALAAAGYMLIGRSLRSRLSLISYIFIVYSMAALLLSGFAIIRGESFTGFQPSTYLFLILLGIVPQLLGHSSFNWALGYLPAAFVSVALLGDPIGATILAMIILKEAPTISNLVGAGMIFAGILVASRRQPTQNND